MAEDAITAETGAAPIVDAQAEGRPITAEAAARETAEIPTPVDHAKVARNTAEPGKAEQIVPPTAVVKHPTAVEAKLITVVAKHPTAVEARLTMAAVKRPMAVHHTVAATPTSKGPAQNQTAEHTSSAVCIGCAISFHISPAAIILPAKRCISDQSTPYSLAPTPYSLSS